MDYRTEIFNNALSILQSPGWCGVDSPEQGEVLREAWECSKFGNLLINAIQETNETVFNEFLFDVKPAVDLIVSSKYFLSSLELWHSQRIRKQQLIAYRGCDRSELEAGFGLSWTLSKDVAEFFANREGGERVIITARLNSASAWLNTTESELIHPYINADDVVEIENASGAPARIDWDEQPIIKPWKLGRPYSLYGND